MVTDTIAHDIRNLLIIVSGCCERLARQTTLPPAQAAELERISRATDQAAWLTSQLVPTARGAITNPEATELNDALRRAAHLLEHDLGERVRIDLRLAPRAAWVPMSEGQVSQVSTNLVLNARDAMPQGGVITILTQALTLDAAAAATHRLPPGDYVDLEVRDNGTGMTPETRARAFDRFFTTKVPGKGTGLGLASVKRVVEWCGGTIDLRSAPGRGTRFALLLPLVDEPQPAGNAASADHGLDARSGESVMVVEDDPVVRDIVASVLSSLGYRTVEAGSAAEALSRAASEHFDLIVTDVDLGDLNGGELARRLAGEAPATKVLFMSGYGDEASLPPGVYEGGAFLQKPFTSRALGERVRALLDRPDGGESTGGLENRLHSQPALADALPAAIFVVQQQRFSYVNAAFAEMMGLDRHQLIGRDSLERVHPDDRNIAPRLAPSAEGTGDRQSVTQIRVRRADGAERSLVITTVPFQYDGASALLGTATDITLQPDVVNMSVRMAALGRLAGGIAHDFNNLLLVVGGQIERLQPELPATSDLRRGLEAISTAAERAAMLTDQLLSFGRRQMLTPQVVDLSGFIGEVQPQLQERLGPDIRLAIRQATGLPNIRADRPRLREVLWHLADNARDAMPSGGTLTIAVDQVTIDADLKARWSFLAVGGVFVRLRVIDTGLGMNPEVMPHVFEPFFTTKGRGRGAGMGLASVYGIVKQSAGYVFVERTGTEGTCVTLLLPAATAMDEAALSPSAVEAHAPATARRRILLVEDDMAVRELLTDVLSAHGFDVSSAETAEQADLRASDSPFDLLLTDIDLPGMSGARLAASLSARIKGLRIMLMSGYPDDGEIAAAKLANRATLLRKPFSTTVLVDRIRQVLAEP